MGLCQIFRNFAPCTTCRTPEMNLLKKVFILLFLIVPTLSGYAQAAPYPATSPHNWDGDYQQLRNNLFPNGFDRKYDNWIQYAPYAAFLTMKLAKVPSRSEWGRLAVSAGTSIALFAGFNNLFKYTIYRERPDGSANNSFPSGHTGTAFTGAHILYREFGHINPWIGFGGYSVAVATSLTRIANNKHWATDTFGGALIGIGSVELGYFIGDLIFKKSGKGLQAGFLRQGFEYDFDCDKHYNLSLLYYHRFVVGAPELKSAGDIPLRSSGIALEGQIPLVPACGICVRSGMSSMVFSDATSANLYDVMVGGYWNYQYPNVTWLEFELRMLLGGGICPGSGPLRGRGGLSVLAGGSVNLITSNNFKIRALAEWQSSAWTRDGAAWLHIPLVGFSANFFW